MSDTLRDRIAAIVELHDVSPIAEQDEMCTMLRSSRWRCECGKEGPIPTAGREEDAVWQINATHVADEVMAVIEPAIATQATDTRLLAIGSCIAYIEHTTELAQTTETPRNARVIGEWAAKIVTAMRMASADITGGDK